LLGEQRKNHTWLYFILVAIYSLAFYLPVILLRGDTYEFPKIMLLFAGGSAPTVIGMILVFSTYTKEEQKDFWKRVFSFRRLGIIWFFVIFLANLIPTVVSIIFGAIMKMQDSTFYGVTEFFANFLGVFLAISFGVLGVFAEELGWRGFALDGLQKKLHPFFSSLILGLYWTAWHFPLFFMEGTYQNKLGFGSNRFFLFCLGLLAQTISITWIYNNTNRSILSALLFHFTSNIFGQMFSFNIILESIRVTIYCIFALIIVASWVYTFYTKVEPIEDLIVFQIELSDQHNYP